MQHPEGVARAVAHGEQHPRAAKLRAFAGALRLQARHAAVRGLDAGHLRAEAHFAARLDNPLAQVLHHRHQHVRADVRLGVEEDVLVRARRGELLEDPADALVFDAGRELAVGERASAALAELDVALGVELARLPEALDLLSARFGVLSPLEDDRAQARLGQHERREHPGRAEAHHDRPVGLRADGPRHLVFRVAGDGRLRAVGHFQNFVLAPLDEHVHGAEDAHVRFFARVYGLFAQIEPLDLRLGDAKLPGGQLHEPRHILPRRQGEIANPDHLSASFAVPPRRPARRPDDQAHCRL